MTSEKLSPFIVLDVDPDTIIEDEEEYTPQTRREIDRGKNEDPVISSFRANRLLWNFNEQIYRQLIDVGKMVSFEEEDTISKQGTPVDSVLFLVKGRAKAEVSPPTSSAYKAVVNLLGPGDDIGLLSLLDGAPHSATVSALDSVAAFSIPYSQMRKLLSNNERCYRSLAEIAVERLRTSSLWIQAFL